MLLWPAPPAWLLTPLRQREAKTLHTSLKELLRTKEPFDRDVDFQRKKRVLLLIPPFPWADNLNKVSGDTI